MKKTHYAVFDILKNGKLRSPVIYSELKKRFPFMGTGVNPVNVMWLLLKLTYEGYIQCFSNGTTDSYRLTQKGRDQLNKKSKVR